MIPPRLFSCLTLYLPGQLTIKPQTDPEGRITFSGKEIPNGRCRTTTVHSLRFKFRFELLHIYEQQECAVGMTDNFVTDTTAGNEDSAIPQKLKQTVYTDLLAN